MKFNIGDRVRYVGTYDKLYNKTGKVVVDRTDFYGIYPITVDFAESGFTFGHDGGMGTSITSCWFIRNHEVELVY